MVFLHEVIKGVADRSYGLYVARLAGFPESVLARAENILTMLESSRHNNTVDSLIEENHQHLSTVAAHLSASPAATTTALELSTVERLLDEVIPDDLTPRQALEILYKLKAAAY